MYKIVYCCNNEYFDGLYLSILSILRRTKGQFAFYLLSVDCSHIKAYYNKMDEIHVARLVELVKSYNQSNTFELIDCSKEYEKLLRGNTNELSHYSPYTMLRLLLDQYSVLTKGKLLYLDVDTMANKSIDEFFGFDLKDNEFAVAHDALGRYWQYKDCFNAGVMLFNMPVAIKNKLFEKARKVLHKKKMAFPDQSALNEATSKYMFFPNDDTRFNNQTRKLKSNTIIKHFCAHIVGWPFFNNIKQWQIDEVHKHLKFHAFDEDYKIFTTMKEKVKEEMRDKFFIKVNHLKKRYGDIKAVDDISFKVKKGSLFAFLGVNGAGKSTTINIISSTLKKDSGEVNIDSFDLDKDNAEVKKLIGIVFQNSVLDGLLSVRQNLMIRAKFYKMNKEETKKNIARVTKLLNLEPILDQDVDKLSGGQRRRVDIARALIHEPKLLMLDEPTTGLDPKTRIDVWKLIDEIRIRTNMTVFLTTHYLEEADKASYVVIMNKGQIIAEGTPNDLKNRFSTDTLISYQKKDKVFESKIKDRKFKYNQDSKAYEIRIKNGVDAKALLSKCNKYITDFEIKKGDMDDVFLNVTGTK